MLGKFNLVMGSAIPSLGHVVLGVYVVKKKDILVRDYCTHNIATIRYTSGYPPPPPHPRHRSPDTTLLYVRIAFAPSFLPPPCGALRCGHGTLADPLVRLLQAMGEGRRAAVASRADACRSGDGSRRGSRRPERGVVRERHGVASVPRGSPSSQVGIWYMGVCLERGDVGLAKGERRGKQS